MKSILHAMSFLTLGLFATAAPATSPGPAADATRPPITAVSHIAVFATDPGKSERFYVHDLGARKGDDPEDPRGVRYYFAPTQFVEVLPLPAGPPSNNRLDHVAFVAPELEGLRKYLAAKGIKVPQHVVQGRDRSQWFDVKDPEGNKIEFVQPPSVAPESSTSVTGGTPPALSHHIIHVGFIIHDRALEDRFFRTVLGFRPYWFGGNEDDRPTWISQQVPDGTDWLEYMLVGTPADMSRAGMGVLDHFALGIPNAQAAYTLLWNEGRLEGQTNTPKIGRDAKWQLNLFDPDGTRAELMELHAIGKPCCSPFTAADPRN